MSSRPAIGDVLLDRYELVEEIGRGGFGVVFRAKQLGMNRDVAVKLLHEAGDDEMRERFKREAMMARNLNHPHTIRQYDFGETDEGLLYLVLEFLDGVNLVEAIGRDGALGDDRVRHVAEGVLKSLGEAHAQGIVHRDLKPANIMICNIFGETDYPKVLDFGIAKTIHGNTDLTQAGVALGSPKYMAPEVLQGVQPTPAADVYSLAITLSEALIGGPLIDSANSVEAARLQLSPEPLPVPEKLRSSALYPWLSIALKKNPEDRFTNASEMLDHLHAPAASLAERGADVDVERVPMSNDAVPTGVFRATPDNVEVDTTDNPDEPTNNMRAIREPAAPDGGPEEAPTNQFAATEALHAVPGPSAQPGEGLAIGEYEEGEAPTEMISLEEMKERMGKAPTAEANPALTPTAEASPAVAPADAPTQRHEAVEDPAVASTPQPNRQDAAFQSQPPGGLGMVPGIGRDAPNPAQNADDEDSTEFVDIGSIGPTITAKEKKSQKTLFIALGGVVVVGLLALAGLGAFLLYMSGDKEATTETPASDEVAAATDTDERIAVKIFTSPRGVAVVIDGQEKAKTPAHFRVKLSDLPKKVELQHPGYKNASVEITAKGKHVFDVKMESAVRMFDDKKEKGAKEPDDEKEADKVEEAPPSKPTSNATSKPKPKPKPKPKDDNPVDIW